MRTNKLYELALGTPMTAKEAANLFGISRSSIYKAMDELDICRARWSRRLMHKKICTIDAWKFVKATWFDDYYQLLLEQSVKGELEQEESGYDEQLMAMHHADKRFITKNWPKLSSLFKRLSFDISFTDMRRAAFAKLIPCIEIDDDYYVTPEYYEAICIQENTGIKLKQL